MATIGTPVYGGNSNNPFWLSANPTSISLQGSAPLVLTNSNGQLAENGQVVSASSNWSLYPAISNTIYMDATHTITNSGNNLYYNGNLIANASDIQNIADWSLYTAASDVTMSNGANRYSIVGAGNITAVSNITGAIGTFTTTLISPGLSNTGNLVLVANTGNLTAAASSVLSNSAPTISNTFTNAYNILGDRGVDYSDFCYTTLSNKGGKGGQINLTADAGSVTISGTTYGVGGLINITANSPLTVPYNATSAIKLSAASILSYAGAVTPLGSLAGYNYIQGTLGVNIIAGSASSVPNTAGTNYLWGLNGTKIQNSLYVDAISNYPGSNLNIHPDSSQWVDILRCQKLGMGNSAVIDGGGGTTSFISNFYGISTTANGGLFTGTGGISTQGSITNGLDTPLYVSQPDLNLYAYKTQSGIAPVTYVYHNINLNSSSNINLVTSNGGQVYINGTAYSGGVSPSNWATYPAIQDVNFSNHSISNLQNINGIGVSSFLRNPLVGNMDAGAYTISNIGNIYGTGASGNLGIYNVLGDILVSAPSAGHTVSLYGGSNAAVLSLGQSGTTLTQTGGQIQFNATGGINVTNNNISNVAGLISTSSITIQPSTGLFVTSFLDMGSHPISNVTGITAPSTLPITTGGTISMNHLLDMGTNGISNVGPLTGVSTINGSGFVSNPVSATINMAQNYISNVAQLLAATGTLPAQGLLISNSSGFINTQSSGGMTLTAGGGINITNGTGTPTYPSGSNVTITSSGQLLLNSGGASTPYHQINMSTGGPLYLSSSNAVSLQAPNIYTYGVLNRVLSTTPVPAPVIQSGTVTYPGALATGSSNIAIPVPYSSTSYQVFITNATGPYAISTSVSRVDGGNFTLYWTGGTSGTLTFDWMTSGQS